MSHDLIHQEMEFKHIEVRNRMVVIRADQGRYSWTDAYQREQNFP